MSAYSAIRSAPGSESRLRPVISAGCCQRAPCRLETSGAVDLPSELAVPIGPGQVDMAGYRLTGLAVGDRVTVPARFSVISCPVFFGMPSGASGRRRSASSDSGQETPVRACWPRKGRCGLWQAGYAHPPRRGRGRRPYCAGCGSGQDRRAGFRLRRVRETLDTAAGAGSSLAAPVASDEESSPGDARWRPSERTRRSSDLTIR
jgi:hypothetical protein